MQTDLKSRTITAVSWSALSQVVTQAFTVGISIVVARLLGPKAYGLLGMITVFTGFANLFHDLGLGAAVIQRKDLEQRHLNAAFWANALMGLLMTLITASLAPVIANFYHEPLLIPLTLVLSLRFVLDSLNVVQIAVMNRNLNFKTLAVIQIWATVISGILGLVLAFLGFGVWSLVVQTLALTVLGLVLSWFLSGWNPRFSFRFKACKELLGVSSYVLGFNIVNYWCRSLDQVLIGRYYGAVAVGIYSRAYSLMLMPLTQISSVVGRVMFPALSAIQDDKPKVKRSYLKAISIIALITFPMMVGLFSVSDHFIIALLGAQWAAAIPIVKIFCWIGLVQSIGTTCGSIYLSQGRTRSLFAMGIVGSLFNILAFVIGIRWGVAGVAWAYFVYSILECYPLWSFSGRLIGLSFSEIVRSLTAPFLCAIAMGVSVTAIGQLLPANLRHWQFLLVQIPLGMVVYLLLIAGLRLEAWQEGVESFGKPLIRRLRSLMVPVPSEG